MRTLAIAALLMVATPALAQRTAVSAQLSPEAAGEAFGRAVVDVCVPAVAGNGVSSLGAAREGKLSPTQDAEMRRQAGAEADETVWDVAEARGVVTVREKAGRCVVSVYGPAAAPVIMQLGAQLENGHRFERLISPQGPNGLGLSLMRSEGGKAVMVKLEGAGPGAQGHQSRFSVVTATVFVAQ
jgi:hypothetical protein